MTKILILTGVLALLFLLAPVVRVIAALLFGKSIAASALAKVPDTIRLTPAGPSPWLEPAAVAELCDSLRARGFEDGGSFTVDEMPGVVVSLFADPRRSLWGAAYEHPRAGRWIEVVTRYADDTSATYTTLPRTGLAPLPGHIHVHAPGLDAEQLLAKAMAERPRGAMRDVAAAEAARRFVESYAEGVAKRKQVGVSRKEVVAVARLPQHAPEEHGQPVS
jgi:hypothetical protein